MFSKHEIRKIKHRENERLRHKQILRLMASVNCSLPESKAKLTQSLQLQRASRYCLFLEGVIRRLEDKTRFNDVHNLMEAYQESVVDVSLESDLNNHYKKKKLRE